MELEEVLFVVSGCMVPVNALIAGHPAIRS